MDPFFIKSTKIGIFYRYGYNENIAKGTTDPRIEFISQVITQILIKQFHNFNQALTSKSQLNISILTKLKLKILVKPSFRILTKPCAQSLNKSLVLCPNLSFQICNRLLPTRSSSSTSATVTTSTSFELASLAVATSSSSWHHSQTSSLLNRSDGRS
jgi:hypothetical protein